MAKKLYYKIGEACKRLDVQPYVLRYWETEFPALSPNKSKSGQRVYSEKDLQVIARVKELLYDEGYTIAGAKKKLEAELASGGIRSTAAMAVADEGQQTTPRPKKRQRAAGSDASGAESSAAEQVDKLRQDIRKALKETRQILALLDANSAKE